MDYILVENGHIVGRPTQLPTVWANISNFHVLDAEKIKEYGWYPYRFVTTQAGPNQVYNGSNFVIDTNEVVEYQQVRDKTAQEISEEIESTWRAIRDRRNQLLSECDWTQLSDSPLTNQKQTEWQIYRQELRDITNQPDPFSITWPTSPEK